MTAMIEKIFQGTKITPAMQAGMSFLCIVALGFIGIGIYTSLMHIAFTSIAFESFYLGGMICGAGLTACSVYEKANSVQQNG